MKPRILIIENSAKLASALKKALEAEGYETITSTRGDEGLARAKAEDFASSLPTLK